MKAFVLTYHSHHVVGDCYALNDHIAFPIDLRNLHQLGFRIVPLRSLIDAVFGNKPTVEYDRVVSITFDDGPVYDIDDFEHPVFGWQQSFLNAMLECTVVSNDDISATSFVIASAAARQIMEYTADANYTFLQPGSMNDSWWLRGLQTNKISIANHSWDHLHPKLPTVAHSRQARADFSKVDNEIDADAQIARAADYVSKRTGGRALPYFAYPFGQSSTFLESDYFPRKGRAIGVEAAFTTSVGNVDIDKSVWSLPRLCCGHHWTDPKTLIDLLEN